MTKWPRPLGEAWPESGRASSGGRGGGRDLGELREQPLVRRRAVVAHMPDRVGVHRAALIFDQAGLRVATVGADNKVNVKTITVARDLGKTIVVQSGIEATDRVIENPPDGIKNGDEVNIAEPTDKNEK